MRTLSLLALLAVASCAKSVSETAGCTATNCQAMNDTCNYVLSNQPDYAWCISNTPAPPDGGTFPSDPEDCTQVCLADDEGVLVQCLASNIDACTADGAPGASPALIDECEAQQTASEKTQVSPQCDNLCQITRAQCQGACPLTDFTSCYDCSLDCSLTAITCRKACPPELKQCTDGKQDGNETGVDCGGDCGPCPEGDFCKTNTDCISDDCLGNTCGAIVGCAMVGDCPTNTCLYGTCR